MDKHTDKANQELSTETAKAFIATLTPDDVREVYSGRQGCMCGCLGKYSVNPAHVKEADAERGYEQPTSGRAMVMVKKVLGILKEHPNARVQDGSIVYVPRSAGMDRNYVLYVCNSKAI